MAKNTRKGGGKSTNTVKPSEVTKMPKAADVRELAQEIRAAANESDALAGDIREIIAAKKASLGIHPGALKRVEAWLHKAKKTDRGLAAVATELAHLDYYRDVLKVDELCEAQGQLIPRTEAGEGETGDQAGDQAEVAEEDRDLRPHNLRHKDAGTPEEPIKH